MPTKTSTSKSTAAKAAKKKSAPKATSRRPNKPTGKPTSVEAYLDALPPERREIVGAIRQIIRHNLPHGYAEGIQYNMIGYFVPHERYPAGYHCNPREPLPFASIASQKNHIGIYLYCIYMDEELQSWFRDAWLAAGCKLDMGKGCVRVKKREDVPLEVVGEAIRRVPVDDFIAHYEANLPESVRRKRT